MCVCVCVCVCVRVCVLEATVKYLALSFNVTRTCTCKSHSQCMQVLYLMDKFNVSDSLYHELSMILTSTPRSYKIKNVRTEINVHLIDKRLTEYQNHTTEYTAV